MSLRALPLLLALAACTGVRFTDDELARIDDLSPADASPPADPTNAVSEDPAAAHLGRYLFFDAGLSADGSVSCATCHDPEHGFADPEPLSTGLDLTARHAPTVLNTAWNRWFFWDGRTDSHWAQATGPIEAPNEHGFSRLEVAHHVYADAELREAYEALFGAMPDLSDAGRFPAVGRPVPADPEDPAHVAWMGMDEADRVAIDRVFTDVTKAIAAYERQLVRVDSPFDTYAQGLRDGDRDKLAALDPSAERGLKLFLEPGQCDTCHAGPNMTDLEFHNLGLEPRTWMSDDDEGRYAGIVEVLGSSFNAAGPYSDDPTGERAELLSYLGQREEMLGQFKTPSLRNVTETAPYMHGGHLETLEDVVDLYDRLQERPAVGHRDEQLLPMQLNADERADLVHFLEQLTGEPLPDELLGPPDSPRF